MVVDPLKQMYVCGELGNNIFLSEGSWTEYFAMVRTYA